MKIYNLCYDTDSWAFIYNKKHEIEIYFLHDKMLSLLKFVYFGKRRKQFRFYIPELNILDYFEESEDTSYIVRFKRCK